MYDRLLEGKINSVARMQGGGRGGGMIDPHPYRGDGGWTQSKNLEGMVR